MNKAPRKVPIWILIVAFAVGAPILLVLTYAGIYQPLKFGLLIRQIESADSPAKEQEAFVKARKWGELWEVEKIAKQDLPKEKRFLEGDYILKIEFLESRLSGPPFVAYRAVLDTNNIALLRE